jgi:glycine dehydrogenase
MFRADPEKPTAETPPLDSVQTDLLKHPDRFVRRHIGPTEDDVQQMLRTLGYPRLDALIDAAVPATIRTPKSLDLAEGRGESGILNDLRCIASQNQVFRSYLGMGYHDCVTPAVIQRNILENPGWYTQYTPYQAEVSQGRLEMLLNFQTMVCDLTGLEIANASLLDEATAAAEAMMMCHRLKHGEGRNTFFLSRQCHPQNIEVVQTRANALGIKIVLGDHESIAFHPEYFGALIQYPDTFGAIHDYQSLVEKAHAGGAMVIVAADLLSLALLKPPGEFGADVAVGSAQRFGVPLGYGGPHAAYFATRDAFKRQMPGRLVGVSKDSRGRPALRLSLGTREQHIRREKATSNICTAQALLANMAAAYAIYHGADGLKQIARRVHFLTAILAAGLLRLGYQLGQRPPAGDRAPTPDPSLEGNLAAATLHRLPSSGGAGGGYASPCFDTLCVHLGAKRSADVVAIAEAHRVNLRVIDAAAIGVALDETVTEQDVVELLQIFNGDRAPSFTVRELAASVTSSALGSGPDQRPIGSTASRAARQTGEATPAFPPAPTATILNRDADDSHSALVAPNIPESLLRRSAFLKHPVFARYHSETEMVRYLKRLETRDLSLTTSMIPLGSCTMKLNATCEMLPVSWPEFSRIHPFAPLRQTQGYQVLFQQLEKWLAEITGFAAISLQPNAGSQGEYTGLLVIRKYHETRGEAHRRVCLIPTSAHGTNPASAVMAGLNVVPVACDQDGNIDVADLRARSEAHKDDLACLMVTYPSTHGVFEKGIKQICDILHEFGGQVYMDGANLNAQVGLCRPAELGADVCHLNLHKTFCIPHGGGGPGMGPIGVAKHLVDFLPGHPVVGVHASGRARDGLKTESQRIGAVAAAPWGSASILPISWVYIAAMGAAGLTEATKVAILNANYISARLQKYFPTLYRGDGGLVAHECILDLRDFHSVTAEDVAKRLMDYGFHAPTLSWPVAGTLMVEPTESESKPELDRFCDAMISIHGEMMEVESGRMDKQDNPLKNAPHTADMIAADKWDHPYSRQQAAFPAPWLMEHKFWPAAGRIDNVYGDRNPICTCAGMEAYSA